MRPIPVAEVVAATHGSLVRGGANEFAGVVVDSRVVRPGELFVAVRGERLDGHRFTGEARRRGAAGVLISDRTAAPETGAVIRVRDTRRALGAIARSCRDGLDARVVAVTGSNGKTTVRSMIAAVLAQRFRVVQAPHNFNNDIGVPLTVFRLEPDTEVGVFELEMNQLGGTRALARICRPLVGVVTNVGDSHLEFMHDRGGVAREKAELVAELPAEGTAVLNADDERVRRMGLRRRCRRVFFGLEQAADVFATDIADRGLGGTGFLLQGKHRVELALPGRHNVANCLAACAAAHVLGVDYGEMAAALRAFEVPGMRLAVRRLGGIVLVDDSYNSNPQSFRAALATVCSAASRENRVVFAGDMLELGAEAMRAHRAMGELVAECADRAVFVGELAGYAAAAAVEAGMDPSRVRRFADSRAAADESFDMVRPGDTILVKGSRGMAMESISAAIVRHYGRSATR